MKRKAYQTPAVEVLKMEECDILAATMLNAGGENFSWEEEELLNLLP